MILELYIEVVRMGSSQELDRYYKFISFTSLNYIQVELKIILQNDNNMSAFGGGYYWSDDGLIA